MCILHPVVNLDTEGVRGREGLGGDNPPGDSPVRNEGRLLRQGHAAGGWHGAGAGAGTGAGRGVRKMRPRRSECFPFLKLATPSPSASRSPTESDGGRRSHVSKHTPPTMPLIASAAPSPLLRSSAVPGAVPHGPWGLMGSHGMMGHNTKQMALLLPHKPWKAQHGRCPPKPWGGASRVSAPHALGAEPNLCAAARACARRAREVMSGCRQARENVLSPPQGFVDRQIKRSGCPPEPLAGYLSEGSIGGGGWWRCAVLMTTLALCSM